MKNSDSLNMLIGQADSMLMHVEDLTAFTPTFVGWKTAVEKYLEEHYGRDSVPFENFHKRYFHPQATADNDPDRNTAMLRDGIKATRIELHNYWAEECEKENTQSKPDKPSSKQVDNHNVFIVHGHNGEMKEATARLLEQQGINGIILHEQPNRGRTIIEKIEDYANVGAAIILLTNDDTGKVKDGKTDRPRARQNVVFEAGYFMGKYGRDRVVLIAEDGIEMPSDLSGVIYTNGSSWKYDVCRELKDMGFDIDINKVK